MNQKIDVNSDCRIQFSRRSFVSTAGAALALLPLNTINSFAQQINPTVINPLGKQNRLFLGMVVFDGFQLLDVFGPLDKATTNKSAYRWATGQLGKVKRSCGFRKQDGLKMTNISLLQGFQQELTWPLVS